MTHRITRRAFSKAAIASAGAFLSSQMLTELPGGAHFSDDDLGRIEAEMRAIVKQDQRFVREELSYDDALNVFADQQYKREIIEKVRAGDASGEDATEAGGDSGESHWAVTLAGLDEKLPVSRRQQHIVKELGRNVL